MQKSRLLQLGLVLIACVAVSWGQGDSIEVKPRIPLNVFSDVNSILVAWSVPDSVIVESISVFRSLHPDRDFYLLDQFESQQTRFLDVIVEPDTHYFYRLEIETADSEIYRSSEATPPFTSLADPDFELLDLYIPVIDSNFVFSRYLQFELVGKLLTSMLTELDSTAIDHCLKILYSDQFDQKTWFDNFTLTNFVQYRILDDISFTADFIRDLKQKLDELKYYLPNRLLMTPIEWQIEIDTSMAKLPDQLELLSRKYQQARSFLDYSDPVRIISAWSDSSDFTYLEIMVSDGGRASESIYSITAGDQMFGLELNSEIIGGYRDTMKIDNPGFWLSLNQNHEPIQQIATVFPEQGFICSFNDEYRLVDSLGWDESHLEVASRNIILNEIIYILDENRISVEVSGALDTTANLALFMDDSLMVNLSGFVSNNRYQTFSWMVDEAKKSSWISLVELTFDSSWFYLESRPVNFTYDIFEARIPDGAGWVSTSFGTLGDANDVTRARTTELAIPEVFALFQNYPNPFNATTTIAFDLLQPAIINLFIADATGRKIDIFLENESTGIGNYQYSWDGRGRSSGVYFFTIQAQIDDFLPVTMSRKMIYLK